MKRDMEVVRAILVALEEWDDTSAGIPPFELVGRDPEVTDYHVKLMKDAGLLKAEFVLGPPPRAIVTDLTWEGHEFLDAIRNERVWARVKEKVANEGGSIPIAILKALAKRYAEEIFGVKSD